MPPKMMQTNKAQQENTIAKQYDIHRVQENPHIKLLTD